MKLRDRIANMFASKQTNSMGLSPAQQFLRFGTRNRPLTPDWSPVLMTPRDKYTGYIYSAIRNRSNKVARLATENLKTDATPVILKKAKDTKETVTHPYLGIIDDSKTFSNYRFWYEIPAFIDLKGAYFLMAVRNVEEQPGGQVRVGNIVEFQLINPFEITRVRDAEKLEIQGYIQNRRGFTRNIPKEMIIEIQDFNPFDDDDPFSMAEAAKDPQFTLREAEEYTRSSIRSNTGAPGIISTDMIMNPTQLENFKARIMGQTKGEPIFSDGAGKVNWNSMQIDLDKAALDKVNEISLTKLLAITGMSKTTFGIEQSGVTRDTSDVQSDQLIDNHSIPRLQLIIDALNQDFKVYYAKQYAQSKYRLLIDSPLGTDREAEQQDITNRESVYNLYTTLVNAGYDADPAARYSQGEITLEELGLPTNPPKAELQPTPTRVTDTSGGAAADGSQPPTETPPPAAETPPAKPAKGDTKQGLLAAIHNALDPSTSSIIDAQEALLHNSVVNIQQRLVMAVVNKVTSNAFESLSDIIDDDSSAGAESALTQALVGFYTFVVPLYATSMMNRRAGEFGKLGEFQLTATIKEGIGQAAKKASLSHVGTILDDLLQAVREASLAGAQQAELVAAIRKEYSNISQVRAKVVAKTETNRAFSMSQFEADKQFLAQNDLIGKAYKKWICRGPDPCVYCLAKQSEPPIPFEQAFAKIGDTVRATSTNEDGSTVVHAYPITYEDVYAGDIHPNGNCGYQLIVE